MLDNACIWNDILFCLILFIDESGLIVSLHKFKITREPLKMCNESIMRMEY